MSLVNSYVLALQDLADELKIEKKFLQNAKDLLTLEKTDDSFFKFIANSIFIKSEKFVVIDLLKENDFNEYFINFLKVLIIRNDAQLLKDILKQYLHAVQERKGIFWGKVFTTQPLTKTKLESIQDVISKKLMKKVMLKNIIDETLISGIKVEIDDKVFALSVATKLDEIKKDLYK